MNALHKSDLPEGFRTEIARLYRMGFSLLPLGVGEDGKKPLLSGWADKRLTLAQMFGPMHRRNVPMYGIRLDGLAVVDCDADDAELLKSLEARFGPSPVHVKTPRGRHLYYRYGGKAPNLRSENLPVDIKTGPRAYVAGPYSMRPDGGMYYPTKGLLGKDPLPQFKTPPTFGVSPLRSSEKIPIGARHDELVKFVRQNVPSVSSLDELNAKLRQFCAEQCESPETMCASELERIADWAWKLRLDNRLYAGRMSAFSLHRQPLDLLRGMPAQEDAIALYVRLVDQHGHIPGQTFPLCHKSMKEAGLTSLSRERFLAARRALEDTGLLKLVGKHKVGKKMQTFTLNWPLDACEKVKRLEP